MSACASRESATAVRMNVLVDQAGARCRVLRLQSWLPLTQPQPDLVSDVGCVRAPLAVRPMGGNLIQISGHSKSLTGSDAERRSPTCSLHLIDRLWKRPNDNIGR